MSQHDNDILTAIKNLLTYADKYSNSMKEIGFGAGELGSDADSSSVAALARIAIKREEQWRHFDSIQRRVMADVISRDEYFSQPEKELDDFYKWILSQCSETESNLLWIGS